MSEKRIGVYGGTFDPIHIGHIEIARAVVRRFALEQLLIIPAHRPPHKTTNHISEAHHRYEMARLAFKDEPRIEVSKMEIELPEKPYTVQTLERLQAQYGNAIKFFFVMGGDSFAELHLWREYQRLLAMTNIIVSLRPGHELSASHLDDTIRARVIDLRGQLKHRQDPVAKAEGCFIYLTDYVNQNVSSTEIRRRVKNGESINGLTPLAVIDYIERHKLYRQNV
ncbi:MAG: nicotinate-nucleotide adenylyltransferase [Acidobacteriota bacterium]